MLNAIVVQFPGSNGHNDLAEAFDLVGFNVEIVKSRYSLFKYNNFSELKVIGLPGGFSYGDYWRAGVLASRQPLVLDLEEFILRGGFVIGICNGFQILVESGLLPGALLHNKNAVFVHRWIDVEVVKNINSPWFSEIESGTILRMPVAHIQGNYYCKNISKENIAFKYLDNFNGSAKSIAGIFGHDGRVLGLMPHPERASNLCLGGDDGLKLFKSLKNCILG